MSIWMAKMSNNDERNKKAIEQFRKRLKNLGIEEKKMLDGWLNVTETDKETQDD